MILSLTFFLSCIVFTSTCTITPAAAANLSSHATEEETISVKFDDPFNVAKEIYQAILTQDIVRIPETTKELKKLRCAYQLLSNLAELHPEITNTTYWSFDMGMLKHKIELGSLFIPRYAPEDIPFIIATRSAGFYRAREIISQNLRPSNPNLAILFLYSCNTFTETTENLARYIFQ